MRYLVNRSTDPYFNMAFDEYCLEHLPSGEDFFFLWRNRPSVIIGLNQNAYAEVNLDYLNEKGITLARRVTGGGAVYHDLQNLNYTFVGREVTPGPFVEALRKLGVPAELSGRNDVFVEGRKVSGYARRVWRDREIVHGTMMYDVDLGELSRALNVQGSKLEAKGIASVRSRVANLKEYLPGFRSLDELQAALQEILADGAGEFVLGGDQLSVVRETARERFSSWEWIYGKSRETDIRRRAGLACGTVEVHVSLDRGLVSGFSFEGDFLGRLSTAGLADSLRGLKFERSVFLEHFMARNMSQYFDDATAEDIVNLIFNEEI